MRIFLYFIVLQAYILHSLFAQECMSIIGQEMLDYEKSYTTHATLKTTDTYSYIPIKFHIASDPSITSYKAFSLETINQNLFKLNQHFAPLNVTFFMCGSIDTIQDPKYYNYITTDENSLCVRDNPTTINVYITDKITDANNTRWCGYAYIGGFKPHIFLAYDCFASEVTFTHEMGHFFSLYHTFETTFGNESVDESNCKNAGDLVCDTPADIISGRVDSLCNYISTYTDINGEKYQPMINNYMSYYKIIQQDCRNAFTPLQYSRMADFYATNNRIYKCTESDDLNDAFSISSFSMYPVPCHGTITLNIKTNKTEAHEGQLYLINSIGQTVYEKPISVPTSEEFSIEEIENGLYIARIVVSNQIQTQKIIVQK